MTYAEIETGVRNLVQDNVPEYRLSALDAYGYTNAGIRTLFRLRPAAFFVDGRMPASEAAAEPVDAATVAAAAGAVDVKAPADDRYLEALIYYVAGRYLERNDADSLNTELAQSYLQKFAEMARM